jgi:histidinol phosphatase-like enzyme
MIVLIFDLDGTLIERYPPDGNDFAPRPLADPERIRALGLPVAIASNQGGIAWGLAGGREGRTYPNWPAVLERVRAGMRLAGVRWAFLALHHPEARLPEGEALLQAAERIRLPAPIALAAAHPRVAPMIRVPEGFVVASWNPGWRKPAPGMLDFVREILGAFDLVAEEWAYVGDEADDAAAARAAGMTFYPAEWIRAKRK